MKALDYLEEGLIALSLAVMVAINFGNVMSRYVFHASWSFSEELMVILFVYNSFLGAALAYRRGAHMGFTILTDSLGGRARKAIVVITTALTLALMALLASYGSEMVRGQMEYGQRTPALGLPEALAGMAVPLGALIISFRVIQACIREISQSEGPLFKSRTELEK
jgi:TRAP-type C4-dicarboxylate transport system permease small subunit